TNIGGGYINGTAESIAFDGLLWTQAPIFYCFSLAIAGLVYAPKMRKGGYVTMFDPFQLKYGRKVGALLFIPQLMSDLFWAASVLSALGNTVAVILDVNAELAIIISAAVAIFYTFLGGLYSVAYTDIIQFFFILIGLYLMFPFALHHEAVDLSRVSGTWLGSIQPGHVGLWLDVCFLLTMGGLPWQVYYQRVLACKDWRTARTASVMCAVASFVLSIPPMMVGVIASSADWNKTDHPTPNGQSQLPASERSATMPLVMQYLVPMPVSIIAIGTVAAAVMSSADSVILSSASVFSKNIYCDIIRPKASGTELVWVLRVSIVVCGCLATVIAVTAESIYGLFVLCSDLMYVVLFPQLTLVLWFRRSNSYGCLSGFFLSFLLRILAGEPLLKLPAAIEFPLYDPVYGQFFPFRTFIMLCSVVVIIVVSLLTQLVFTRGWLPARFDIMHCLRQRTIDFREPKEMEPMTGKPTEAPAKDGWTEDGAVADGVGDRVRLARSPPGDL
ncbi:high-affinity choline transporter 1-like, partial [Littorina saxatilis]|uniref:high-affinity choline transporter 1-like n=1 Tax=Littorina saxatilis TaxID=31220 RepID=UPI0038B4AA49